MAFLLVTILILLILAMALASWLTWWWVHRRFEDVTTQHKHALHELATLREQSNGDQVAGRLDAMSATLDRVAAALPPDFMPAIHRLDQRLGTIEAAVRSHAAPDLTPLLTQADDMAGQVRRLRREVAPVDGHLQVISARLDALQPAVAPRKTAAAPPPALLPKPVPRPSPDPLSGARREGGGRNLLKSAAFGTPDDLKRIIGVGPKLEGMLHNIGVYYFWQVSRWLPADVSQVDDLLDAFKGRIERDAWVMQAKKLAAEPGSANPPS